MNKLQGWLNLYKSKNISSFKAINKIKKKFNIKKIGHAGTLDPDAEGVLPVAIGNTTKLIKYITTELKIYRFSISWGTQTSTDDSRGDVIYQSNLYPNYNDIVSKTKEFIGNQLQIPPKVSAIKINGQRAYKLFRENKEIDIKSRPVFVKTFKILKHSEKETFFEIECGKGFYIRSLGRDLAIGLGTFGHISNLERLKVGKFSKETSILLDDLIKIGNRQNLIDYIHPSISMLDDILAYEIESESDLFNLSLGKSIIIDDHKIKKSSSKFIDKELIFLSYEGDIVSIGKLVGNLFKPKKVLL